jgi:hypothetical protein
MFTTACEVCGKRNWFPHRIDDFRICTRCARVQKKSKIPVAELVAKNLAASGKRAKRTDRTGDIIILAVLGLGCFWWFNASAVRVPVVQVPVTAHVRPSWLVGNVLMLMNKSDKVLTGVRVSARNPGANSSQSVTVGQIQPGEVKEIGTLDWGWVVEKNESVTVSADGFALPIVFTSEQLGVK